MKWNSKSLSKWNMGEWFKRTSDIEEIEKTHIWHPCRCGHGRYIPLHAQTSFYCEKCGVLHQVICT